MFDAINILPTFITFIQMQSKAKGSNKHSSKLKYFEGT